MIYVACAIMFVTCAPCCEAAECFGAHLMSADICAAKASNASRGLQVLLLLLLLLLLPPPMMIMLMMMLLMMMTTTMMKMT
jgi:hypothetical protein